MKKVFSLCVALLTAWAMNAAVININNGTPDALRKALGGAASGDVIMMAAGTYEESNSDYIAFTGKDVTVMAEEGAEVIVVPKVPVRLKSGARAEFINIKFDCGHLSDIGSYSEIIVPADGTEGKKVILNGCEFYGWKQKSNAIIHTRSDRQLDSLVINNCYFHDNLYNCVYLKYASIAGLVIKNSTFANITTDASAPSIGVIDVQATAGSVLIDHCTFYNAQAKNTDYGAIKIPNTIAPVVSNCIFAMPEEYADGRAVYVADGEVKNCLTYNYTKDDNTGIHSGPTVTDCIIGDPKFVDAANADYRVDAASPVLGAGTEGSDLGDPRWIPQMEYYLVGNMTEWVADPKFKLVKAAEGDEYTIKLTLFAGDEFKVAKSDGLSISDANWFPMAAENFKVKASGEYTVYFDPNGLGGEDWYEGYILAEGANLGPWDSWFGDASWQQETNSYITFDPAAEKATVYIRENKNGQWQAQVKYQGIPVEDGKCYHVALKMKANNDINGVTLKWQDDNNVPNVIYENQTINLGANDEYVYDEVVKGVLGEKGSTGLLVLDFGYASAGDVIEIYGVIIEETECPEPPTYYLVGSMTEWATLDEYRFTESAEVAGEFTLETQLEAGMLLKVVGISEGEETWYPAGFQDGYEVDAAHAGLKTVYFRPAGNEDWAAFGGYIYIDATHAVSNVNAAANTNRYLRDGQVFIQIDGKTYNVLGQKIAQ